MRSPLTIGGIAGGQDTDGEAQMRPKESSVGIRSELDISASRIEITLSGRESAGGVSIDGSFALSASNADFRRVSSSSVVSVEGISVSTSRSAYSGSMRNLRRCSASSSPR